LGSTAHLGKGSAKALTHARALKHANGTMPSPFSTATLLLPLWSRTPNLLQKVAVDCPVASLTVLIDREMNRMTTPLVAASSIFEDDQQMTESQHLLPCVFRARPDIDLMLFGTTSFTRCGLTLMFLHRGATALWALYSLLMPDISQIQASQVSASLGVQCMEAVRCNPTLQVVRMCFISLDSRCSDLRHALHSRNTTYSTFIKGIIVRR
jgi:hypothetical protein